MDKNFDERTAIFKKTLLILPFNAHIPGSTGHYQYQSPIFSAFRILTTIIFSMFNQLFSALDECGIHTYIVCGKIDADKLYRTSTLLNNS